MPESDVVSRLLAAIDERERGYDRVAAELQEAARAKVEVPNGYYLRSAIADGLRLCQAHRDIVAEWQRNKQIADQLQHEAPQGDAYLVAKGIVAGLWASVVLVARGYGVEDGESGDE